MNSTSGADSYQDDSRYCSSASHRVSDFQNAEMVSTEFAMDTECSPIEIDLSNIKVKQ